jgi:N-acetylglutamate synthase-like GNAT family acetyltransferase
VSEDVRTRLRSGDHWQVRTGEDEDDVVRLILRERVYYVERSGGAFQDRLESSLEATNHVSVSTGGVGACERRALAYAPASRRGRMEIRDVEPDDADAVRRAARRSFEASYALDPSTIEALLEGPFSEDRLAPRITDAGTTWLLAEREGEVAGFAELRVDEVEVVWLHVHPDHRDSGVGTALLERLREGLPHGVDRLRASVLGANAEDETFAERHGFEHVDRAEREVADERLVEHVYADVGTASTADGHEGRPPGTVTVDGAELTVDDDDRITGRDAPFFRVLDGDERFGLYCSNCGTVVEAMDEFGRVEWGTC